MTDILLQIGATKLVLAVALAGVVWVVTRRVARPAIAHALWLMVLFAMLVPAVVPLRVLPEEAAVEEEVVAMAQSEVSPLVSDNSAVGGHIMGAERSFGRNGKPLVALAWLLGSAGFLGWTLVRTVRFQRTLTRAARPAPQLQRLAVEIGGALGMPRVPRVYTTGARLRPLVWWAGGKVRILIPSVFLAELDETELRAVLAHELAHVRRRDHLVRIVEWLACSAFWWNPVVWWARRELRSAEESCCDVLAVSAMKSTNGRYARSLLHVVEIMSAGPVERTPALASAAGGGRDSRQLEKRLRTVLGAAPGPVGPRWLRTPGRAALVVGLSLGLVYCDTAERLVAPDIGQARQPTTSDMVTNARAEEPATIVLLPRTQRDWFVAWDVASVASGPGPHPIAVEAPPDCRLYPVERKDGDLRWAHELHDQHIACMMAWAERMEAGRLPLGPNGGCIGFDVAPARPIWACTSMVPADISPFLKVGAVRYALRGGLPQP